MFRIFQSNRHEQLLDALLEALETPCDVHPLAPEVVVCERGIDRWVLQSLARRTGIACNLETPPPAAFIWQALRQLFPGVPRQSPWEKAALAWQLFALLGGELLQDPAFAPVREYLASDPDQRKRYQLAQRLAGLFDQYMVYRHDMVLAWEAGRQVTGSADEAWQQKLWRAVADRCATRHRAHLLAQCLDAAARGALPAHDLPQRISVFAVPALPPVYVEVLAALGQVTQVDLYALNPCREFWEDAKKLSALWPEAERYGEQAEHLLQEANPLLASGGARIQHYFAQLTQHDAGDTPELFREPPAGTLLGRLQLDILDNRHCRDAAEGPSIAADSPLGRLRQAILETDSGAVDWRATDGSLQCHGCHSLQREVEVLHDRLLEAFQLDPTLQPADVLVLAPDIALAAPYIEAVFGAAEKTPRHIPWTLADVPRRGAHPLIGAFEQLLALPESRLAASEVLGLLEMPAVSRRFGRLGPEALASIRRWVAGTGIRWGFDGRDRAAAPGGGGVDSEANTWRFGFDRLFTGLAVDDACTLVAGRAPYVDLEGSEAAVLGMLRAFIERLAEWRLQLSRAQTAEAWRDAVRTLCEQFFDAESPEEEHALDAIDEAARAFLDDTRLGNHVAAISPEVFREDFGRRLEEPGTRGGLLRGVVTFARLAPARSLPYRMLCLIGMNDERFPRREAGLSFDLARAKPQPGDRSRREDDRHLFLETLLAARDRLHVSYTDRSLRDNAALQASVVVEELLDYALDVLVGPNAGADLRGRARKALVVQHPLQPFSPRQFRPDDPRVFSYDTDWLPAAQARGTGVELARPLCAAPLPPASHTPANEPREIDLAELESCLRQPARWFLRQRLNVFFEKENAAPDDSEPFQLASDFALDREWLDRLLLAQANDEWQQLLRARGQLPLGVLGALSFEARSIALESLRTRLAQDPGTYAPLDVRIQLAPNLVLVGRLPEVAGCVQRVITTSKKLHATLYLEAWVRHLALAAVMGSEALTRLESLEESSTLDALDIAPQASLLDLVAVLDAAEYAPLRFFPKSAWVYEEQTVLKGNSPPQALARALACWKPDFKTEDQTPEAEDPNYQACFGHETDPLAHPAFTQLADRILGPAARQLLYSKQRAEDTA